MASHEYSADDIQIVDAIDSVRARPAMYFKGGVYDPIEIATWIAGEALMLGAQSVRIEFKEGWFLIIADHDWLAGRESQAFTTLAHIPEVGQNSRYGEILAVAFCRNVATSTPHGIRSIKGEDIGPLASFAASQERIVAFDAAPE
ncbi:hypothetical protein OHA25_54100 [Nonomuraea sp. NBC_00507]|uniref:hypothetical protein n=1 Tax=Nonomuraea sp. NBC_00507 TaxID=2976002 RepID=UPI002E1904D6